MSYRYPELAAGRWSRMPLVEQMANIGSEVERALNWQAKDRPDYSKQAAERALELFDLSLESGKKFAQLKEVARLREVVVDYFYGANEYRSTEASLKRYFLHFAYAARRNR